MRHYPGEHRAYPLQSHQTRGEHCEALATDRRIERLQQWPLHPEGVAEPDSRYKEQSSRHGKSHRCGKHYQGRAEEHKDRGDQTLPRRRL
jgi:hypothetical protein